MTTAALGFKIDSSQASSAAVDLEKLYAAASKMDAAADSLTTSAGALAGALKRVGDETKKVPPVGKTFQDQDEHVRAFRAEIERLTSKYQPLAQATQRYEASISEINRAHQLGVISAQQMQKALDGERLAFERLKTSAMGAGHAVKAANQNGVTGAQRAAGVNAGYQFQDIAVTAAMGMNPLMIGLQQGTQLASVVSSMERPVAGLASAFVSLINPVSLITIGLTAGVAALVQYFATADEGSKELEEHLAKQGELIESVAARWGDAYPALKAYADELQRAREETDLAAAASATQELRVRGLLGTFDALAARSPEISRALRDVTSPEGTKAVQDYGAAMITLRADIEAGVDPTNSLTNAQAALRTIMGLSGTEAIRSYSDAFFSFAQQAWDAANANKALNEEIARGKFGGTSVQDLLERNYFVDKDGRTRSTNDFVPLVPGIPSRRPLDLARDPDIADTRIMNADGRLTGVPIPGQKPNIFELEKENEKVDDLTKAYRRAQEAKADFWLDLSFAERQAGRSAMDRQIATTLTRYGFDENMKSREADALRNQYQSQEINDIFKGFFTSAYQEAWNNGGKIGEAIVNSALTAAQKATEKAFDSLFDQLSSKLTSWVMGAGGKSVAGTIAAGFTPNTTLSALLGAGGKAANDNSAATSGGMAAYRAAIAKIESGGRYDALGPVTRSGDRAYGKYQMMGNNIGPWSKDALGRSITKDEFLSKPGLQDQIFDHKFGGYVDKYGAPGAAQAWFGGPGSVGKGGKGADILGTTGNSYVSKFNKNIGEMGDKAGDAVTNLGGFSNGLGKLGSTLQSIPQAMMANGGGGGILSGLTKYGLSLFSGSSQFSNAWLSGGIGLYAKGTNNAPGGMSIVGERGPELLNIPQGSGVMSNHKLMNALNENGGKSQPVNIRVDVSGARGNSEIEDMVSKGVRQGIQHYDRSQAGRTAVKAVQSYQERFG